MCVFVCFWVDIYTYIYMVVVIHEVVVLSYIDI